MTPSSVTVPAAKAALIAQLQAQPQLADVAVHWGLRPETPTERERVYVLGVRDLARGGGYETTISRETYGLRVLIEAHLAERDQQIVETRGWELYAQVEQAVAADPELAGAVRRATLAGADDSDTYATDDGWVTQIAAIVTIVADIDSS